MEKVLDLITLTKRFHSPLSLTASVAENEPWTREGKKSARETGAKTIFSLLIKCVILAQDSPEKKAVPKRDVLCIRFSTFPTAAA